MTGDVAVFFQVVGYWRGVFVCLGYVFVWWVGCLFACLTVGVAVAVFFPRCWLLERYVCVFGVCVCLFVCLFACRVGTGMFVISVGVVFFRLWVIEEVCLCV